MDSLDRKVKSHQHFRSGQKSAILILLTCLANISVSSSWCFLSKFPAEARSLAWSFMVSSVSAWKWKGKQYSCQMKTVFKENKIHNHVPKLFPRKVKEIAHAKVYLSDKNLLNSHAHTISRYKYLWEPELKVPDACVEPLLATSFIELLSFVNCYRKQVVPFFLQLFYLILCVLVTQSHLTLCRPHELQPTSLLCPWDFPGNNTGVDCHALLQGIFPTPGFKSRSPVLLADSLSSDPPGKPYLITAPSLELRGHYGI